MQRRRTGSSLAALDVKRRIFFSGLALVAWLAVAPAGAGAAQGAAEFYARGPSGTATVSCAIYDGYAGQSEALCEHISGHAESKATLSADGSVVLCRGHSIESNRCGLGNVGENAPTYRVGKTVTVGRFACAVQAAGVRCTVTATGKGFLLGTRRLRAVGGASVDRTGAHASNATGADGFLSPDRKTWCSGTAKEVGCVSFRGPVDQGAGHGAVLSRGGKLTLCPESSAGPAWACFQNFDESAPVLHYGKRAEVGPFVCASKRQGITCTVRAGGRGFRIDRDEVVAVP
jgi:hypothetical protein